MSENVEHTLRSLGSITVVIGIIESFRLRLPCQMGTLLTTSTK